jgi:ribulose-bisphosphate carboxylase large chain
VTGARITAIYHVTDSADRIAARANGIAVEQSIEMPVEAVQNRDVLDNIVGQVEGIAYLGGGHFEVRIGLAVATTGPEPGQLFNMLFGNTSIHADVELKDAFFPEAVLTAFGGPRQGLAGWRRRCKAENRAMTCSALKPQGLPPAELAKIAAKLAAGGLDFIKDDHGIADQAYSPFAERVPRIAEAVAAARSDGGRTGYLPSLNGNLDQLRRQIEIVRAAGLDAVLVTPMIAGVSNIHVLGKENPDIAFMAHPALAGASRIAPPLHLGKIFRLLGADATVFPNHGGRFGYSPQTCRELAQASLGPWGRLKDMVPVPAGGMTPDRVPEMLEFYGKDTMLLIGGGLLAAGDHMTAEAARFVERVAQHG